MRLGPFELLDLAGKGGMGDVFRARRDTDPHDVAVKVLRVKGATTRRFRSAFRNEVRLSAGLDHRDIVQVLDHGEAGPDDPFETGTPYLVMEYVPGSTLRERAGRMSWSEIRTTLLELLDALAHAHARRVIHRDLKPKNVIVGACGIKLTDFGLAHALEGRPDDADWRTTFVGTPAYMAPEQFRGTWRDHGPWTDLYALGCLAYTLLTGRPPFRDTQSIAAGALAHCYLDPPPLKARCPVPAGLTPWLHQLLDKDPGRRFQRPADAAWALEGLDEPTGPAFDGPLEDDGDTTTLTDSMFGELDDRGLSPDTAPASATTEALSAGLIAPTWTAPAFPKDWRQERHEDLDIGLGVYGLRTIPMVGRESERDALWSELEATDAPRVVLLHGPSGCGKTRLARWLAERSHEVGATLVLSATHGSDIGAGHGLGAMVARLLGAEGLDAAGVRERLAAILRGQGVHDGAELEALTQWIVPTGPPLEDRFAVLVRLVERLATTRRVLLWLDDVAWGGDGLRLAAQLTGQSDARVLVVCTASDADLASRELEQELLGQLDPVRIEVGPLPSEHRHVLVSRLLRLRGSLARRVEAATAGNPAFAVQLVGDWVERGLLQRGDDGFSLAPGTVLEVPETLQEIWAARVRDLELAEAELQALERAAVLGLEVDMTEWSDVADASVEMVDLLLKRRLARCSEAGPSAGWAFASELLRSAFVARARDGGRLQEHHRACAGRLLGRTEPGMAERVGRHLLAGGSPRAAISPLLDGARERHMTGDYGEAEALLAAREEALRAVEVPEMEWGRGWLLRFRIARRRGRTAEAERWLRKAESVEPIAVEAAVQRGRFERKQGRIPAALGILEQAVADARGALRAQALLDLAECRCDLGKLDEAEVAARKALKGFARYGDRAGAARALQNLGEIAKERGEYAEAVRLLSASSDAHADAGFRWGRASAINSVGDALRYQGDHAGAADCYLRAGRIFRSIGSGSAVYTDYNRCLSQLEQGDFAAARAVLDHAMPAFERMNHRATLADTHVAAAACAFADGDLDGWNEHLRRAEVLYAETAVADVDSARLAELAWRIAGPDGERARKIAEAQWRALGRDDDVARVSAAPGCPDPRGSS